MSQPILIAGGGITGLTLALSLTQNGVPVRIIDQAPKAFIGQRGLGVHPRTLEMHNLLGTLPDVLAKASPSGVIDFYAIGAGKDAQPLKSVSPTKYVEPTADRPWPNIMYIWQSTHMSVLREHLKKLGVEVEYGIALKSFTQDPDGVTAVLTKTVGEEETETETEMVRTPYLIGAEGARSVVRKGIGLTFVGETNTERSVLVDVEVINAPEPQKDMRWSIYGEINKRMALISPCREANSNYFNFILSGNEIDFDKVSSTREAAIEEFYAITGRTDIEFGKTLGISKYLPSVRMVDMFQQGRCFVAGDAAHVHSAAGGQGLNSGIQDAMNLGWKLAHAYKGLAPSSLLDSYTEERLPVIAAMLNKTKELHIKTHKLSVLDPKNDAFNRGGDLNMLGINYRGSSILVDGIYSAAADTDMPNAYKSGVEVRAGDRAPDAPGLVPAKGDSPPTSLFKLFTSHKHTVLIFANEKNFSSLFGGAIKLAKNGIVEPILILPAEVSTPAISFENVFIDQKGHAYNAYVANEKKRDATAFVVRPDGYVGAMVTNWEGLNQYFSRILKSVKSL